MSATATPMGAEPVGGLSACGSFSGKVRHIKIASGYAANIFYGDFVKLVNTGTIEKDAGTATATPSGGTPGYTYSWSSTPIQTTQTATGLSAGITYTCIDTDSK